MKKLPILLNLVAGLLVSCGTNESANQSKQESSNNSQQSGDSGGQNTDSQQTTGGGNETGGNETQTKEPATLTLSKDVSSFDFSNGDKPTTIKFSDEITLTCSLGTNTKNNAPAYYTSDCSLRFYFGNTLTISNSDGNITHMTLSYNGSNEDILFTSNVGTMSSYGKTWDGSSSSVAFKADGESGNIKLFSLTITYTYGGSTTGGGTTTGGGNTDTGGGGSTSGGGGNVTPAPGTYTKTWPTEYQKYIDTYLNGLVPCFLDVNKNCVFNGFATKCIEGTQIPYFNPYVKNTSPSINYTHDYGVILKDAGFQADGASQDEDGVTHYYYKKGLCNVEFAKYKNYAENIYYFDVYAYYDYTAPLSLPNSKLSLDVSSMGLTNKYENYSKTIGSYTLSGTDIMKNSYNIQLKANSGMLIIEGPSKGVAFIVSRNADQLFVRYGTSSNDLKYAFNEGGTFNFPSQASYIEITSGNKVLEIETIDVLN